MQTQLKLALGITQADIERARGNSGDSIVTRCPVARAVRRAFEALGVTGIPVVGICYARFLDSSETEWIAKFSLQTSAWISDFDGGRPALPASFDAEFERVAR